MISQKYGAPNIGIVTACSAYKATLISEFQVRKKATTLYFAQNPKDRRKLDKLIAAEKCIVTVSEITGEAVFFGVVTESNNQDLQISKVLHQNANSGLGGSYL